MAFRYLLMLSFAALFLGGCVEGVDDQVTGTTGGNALVKIAFKANALNPVEGRSLTEDQEKELHNLHVLIFDTDGRIVTNRHYSNVQGGSVEVETYAGNNRTIFVLANDSGQTGDDREDVTYSQALLQITKRDQLDALLVKLSNPDDLLNRQRGLMSVGQLSPVNIGQGSGNSIGPIGLHFVSARIDLTVVDATPTGASFTAYAWDIVNLPLQSFVVERAYAAGSNSDAVDPANSNHFKTTAGEYAFTEGTNGKRTASFYMLENRRGGRVANPNTPPSGYTPGAIDSGSDKDKAWYAPAKATYVIVYGVYEKDGNSQMIKACIYLGRDNNSDYNVYRGDKQQYTVTVNGMDDISIDSNVEPGQSSFSVATSSSLDMDAHPDFCVFMITGIAEGGTPNYATVEILDASGKSFGDAGFAADWLKISPLNLYRHSVKQSSGEWQQLGTGQSSGSFVRPKYIPHKSYRQSNPGKKTALWDKITSDGTNYPADDDALPFDKATYRMCYKITGIPYTASAAVAQQYITLYADEMPFGNTGTRSATVRVSFGHNAGVDEIRSFNVSQSGAAAITGGLLEVEKIEESTLLKSPGLDAGVQQTTQMQWGYNNQSLYAGDDRFSYGNYLTANAVYTGVTGSGTPKVPAWSEGDASVYRPKWPRTGTVVITEPTSTASLGTPYFYPAIVSDPTGYFHPIFNASAARYCHEKNRDLNGDGKIDASETVWYLPSFADLRAVYNAGAGNILTASPYWTATEESATNSWTINPSTGTNASAAKTNAGRVRCVRGAGAPALAEATLTSNESDKSKLNLTAAAGGSKFNIADASASGFTWTVASSASGWLTVSSSATAAGSASQTGTGSKTDYYAYAPENTGDARSATLTLTRTASGSKTVTVSQAKSPYDKSFAGLLAVDESGKLNLDGNGTLLFFQFGSVVGFTQLGDWAAGKVLYNPVTGSPSYSSYTSIPVYTMADYNAGRTSISASTYHNGTNVKAGKGDPCKLVGLTAAQVQSMTAAQLDAYKSGWRLPTSEDQKTFTGQSANATYSAHWTAANATLSSLAGGYFPKGEEAQKKNFLPAAGYRNTSGSTSRVGVGGYYWSCEAYNSSSGYNLRFGSTGVNPLDNNYYADGFAVRCVVQEDVPDAGAVLMVDASGKLNVDNNGKMAFFQFGSVVCFTQEGSWAANMVLFNPVTGSPSYSSYTSIPVYTTADYNAGRTSISASTYHNGTNVKAGKGDPCKLVGLTGAQVQSMSAAQIDAYDSGWRIATKDEQCAFTGQTANTGYSAHWTASSVFTMYYSTGSAGGYFPKGEEAQKKNFLPAAGYRSTSGTTGNVGSYGYYWSCEAYNSSSGYRLYFGSGNVRPLSNNGYAYGFGARCVRK